MLPQLTRTGDGLIAALQILSVICRTGKPASELLSCFTPIPQRLVNLRDIDMAVLSDKRVTAQVAAVEAELAVKGACCCAHRYRTADPCDGGSG